MNVKVPFEPSAPVYESNVEEARVTLPQGMGLNPSAANGLQACTNEQFGKGTRNPVACPATSKIGTVSIDTPPLPNGTLTGNVYLGQQLSAEPESGEEFRVFLDAESASRGLSIRLIANVIANRQTGQLTAEVHDAPQLPFDSVQVKLEGGSKATLTSPPTCGPNATTHAMTAWSGTPDGGPQDKGFTLTSAPGGGACAENACRTPLRTQLRRQDDQPEGRRLHPVQRRSHPRRRQPGAERRRPHPAARAERQIGRRHLLPRSGARRRQRGKRRRRAGQARAARETA